VWYARFYILRYVTNGFFFFLSGFVNVGKCNPDKKTGRPHIVGVGNSTIELVKEILEGEQQGEKLIRS